MISDRPVRWGKGTGVDCSKWLKGFAEMKTSGHSRLAMFIADKPATQQNQTSSSALLISCGRLTTPKSGKTRRVDTSLKLAQVLKDHLIT